MNDDTLLHRQVSPAWIQAGHITSQVFRPTPKDQKKLSVYDGDLISAEDSWIHFTDMQGFESFGVMSVTVEECQSLELSVQPEPEPFPEHAIIDFGDLGENQIRKKAKRLKAAAETRGWQYRIDKQS